MSLDASSAKARSKIGASTDKDLNLPMAKDQKKTPPQKAEQVMQELSDDDLEGLSGGRRGHNPSLATQGGFELSSGGADNTGGGG